MIIDHIHNKNLYASLDTLIKRALDYCDGTRENPVAIGSYELDGRDLIANVQEYETKETSLFEAHEKYIDVQYIISGEEKIGWAPLADLATAKEYDADADYALYHPGERGVELVLRAGDFAVFYPGDAHRPGTMIDSPATVRKIVMKIRVSALK